MAIVKHRGKARSEKHAVILGVDLKDAQEEMFVRMAH